MKKICFVLSSILIFPHIIFYMLINHNSGVITMDINRWLLIKGKNYNCFIGFIYLILRYPEFRSLFYHRIGKTRSLICKYLPGRTNLYFHTPSIFYRRRFLCRTWLGYSYKCFQNRRELWCRSKLYNRVT